MAQTQEFRLLDEELSLVEAEKRYNQAKRNLEFSSVKAPISGSISSAKVTNIGQLVNTGDLLSEIVPKDDMLKIEASVLPKDIAYVWKGQKAKIAFTAYDMAIYGQFEGVVTKIASNTTSTQDGTTYYPAIIEIDYDQVNESERKVILQSGMQICFNNWRRKNSFKLCTKSYYKTIAKGPSRTIIFIKFNEIRSF